MKWLKLLDSYLFAVAITLSGGWFLLSDGPIPARNSTNGIPPAVAKPIGLALLVVGIGVLAHLIRSNRRL